MMNERIHPPPELAGREDYWGDYETPENENCNFEDMEGMTPNEAAEMLGFEPQGPPSDTQEETEEEDEWGTPIHTGQVTCKPPKYESEDEDPPPNSSSLAASSPDSAHSPKVEKMRVVESAEPPLPVRSAWRSARKVWRTSDGWNRFRGSPRPERRRSSPTPPMGVSRPKGKGCLATQLARSQAKSIKFAPGSRTVNSFFTKVPRSHPTQCRTRVWKASYPHGIGERISGKMSGNTLCMSRILDFTLSALIPIEGVLTHMKLGAIYMCFAVRYASCFFS